MFREKILKTVICGAVAVSLASSLCSCYGAASVVRGEEEKIYTGSYEEIINEFYEDHKDTAAGMEAAVFDSEGIIYEGYYGYADVASEIPMTEDTVIDWGSATKTLVWVSAMQLYEQGLLDLNADIRTYLPEGFLTNLRYDKPVTMIELMNHRAGFQEYYTDLFLQPVYTDILSLEDALRQDPPEQIFEPDTITAYSNWGAALAGYIVERVSGMSFADYVHANIFEPLGMNDTAILPDLSDNPSVRERRESLVCYSGIYPMGTSFFLIQLYPAGACVSTLDDFVKYASSFVAEECPFFEDQATFDLMMSATSTFGNTNFPKNAHGFWALPWGMNTYGHGGNTNGCSSMICFDLSTHTGAVVMTNQSGEENFNYNMLKALFNDAPFYPVNRVPEDMPQSGFLRSARTALRGHYRIASANYLNLRSFEEMYWTYNDNDGIPKLETQYTDYYFAPASQYIPEITAIYGWAAALTFSFVSLLVKPIRWLSRKIKKKPNVIPMGKWSGLVAFVQLLIGTIGLAIVILMTTWIRSANFLWLFKAAAALGVVLAGLAVYGIVKTGREKMSLKRRLYNFLTIFFCAVTIFFLIVEQMW